MATKNQVKKAEKVEVAQAVSQVSPSPSASKKVSDSAVLSKKIQDSVRDARNAGVFSASDFTSGIQQLDGKVANVKQLTFKNSHGAELTLKSALMADSKLPRFELSIRAGETLKVLRGDVAQKCFKIAEKELKGKRKKAVLSEAEITELSSFF